MAWVRLLLVAAFFLVPNVVAVQPEGRLTVGTTEEPIVPDVGAAIVPVRAEFDCTFEENPTGPIQFSAVVKTAPGYATAALDPLEQIRYPTPGACAISPHVFTANLTVTVARSAPALDTQTYEVEAFLQTQVGSQVAKYGPYTAKTNFTVGFTGATSVESAQLQIDTRPGKTVTIPLDVKNLGNGPALVTFRALASDVKTELPAAITLESRTTSGDGAKFSATPSFKATAPKSAKKFQVVEFGVEVSSKFAGPGAERFETDTTVLTFALRMAKGADALPLLAAVVALTGVAFFRRRG